MTIHEFEVDPDKFAMLELVDDDDQHLLIDGWDTQPMAASWPAPRVRLIEPEPGSEVLVGDFPDLAGAIPVLSDRAVHALHDLIKNHGELLPLASDDGEYWAFNVLTTVDLMDEKASEAEYLAPDRILLVRKLVVRRDAPSPPPIFKLPQWRKGSPLVTDRLLDAAVAHGLLGLDARPLCVVDN
jgi:hypothetical protein